MCLKYTLNCFIISIILYSTLYLTFYFIFYTIFYFDRSVISQGIDDTVYDVACQEADKQNFRHDSNITNDSSRNPQASFLLPPFTSSETRPFYPFRRPSFLPGDTCAAAPALILESRYASLIVL